MDKTDVREQNLYFQMESIKDTEAGIYDDIAGESGTPVTNLTAEKFPPQGAEEEIKPSKQHKNDCGSHTVAVRRLMFISITAAVVAFLTAVVCLIITLIAMMSRINLTPSKDCDTANSK